MQELKNQLQEEKEMIEQFKLSISALEKTINERMNGFDSQLQDLKKSVDAKKGPNLKSAFIFFGAFFGTIILTTLSVALLQAYVPVFITIAFERALSIMTLVVIVMTLLLYITYNSDAAAYKQILSASGFALILTGYIGYVIFKYQGLAEVYWSLIFDCGTILTTIAMFLNTISYEIFKQKINNVFVKIRFKSA